MIRVHKSFLTGCEEQEHHVLFTLEDAKDLRRTLGRAIELEEKALEEQRRNRLAEEYVERSTRW